MFTPEELDTFKLCYISGGWAYFTTQALEKQWGDDWDDAPYEHNAGRPYQAHADFLSYNTETVGWEHKSDWTNGVPNWRILALHIVTDMKTPDTNYTNSPFSVQMINRGDAPWLRAPNWNPKATYSPIYAGTTLRDFITRLRENGGTVYIEFTEDVSNG